MVTTQSLLLFKTIRIKKEKNKTFKNYNKKETNNLKNYLNET